MGDLSVALLTFRFNEKLLKSPIFDPCFLLPFLTTWRSASVTAGTHYQTLRHLD